MSQLYFPWGVKEISKPNFEDPEETIRYFEQLGYEWLVDCNGPNGKKVYVPYRINFPGERILDESEIFYDILDLEKRGFSIQEIKNARMFYESINHEEVNLEKHKFGGRSFISKKDEIESIKKYLEKPFFKK